jgi:hypothetical protein
MFQVNITVTTPIEHLEDCRVSFVLSQDFLTGTLGSYINSQITKTNPTWCARYVVKHSNLRQASPIITESTTPYHATNSLRVQFVLSHTLHDISLENMRGDIHLKNHLSAQIVKDLTNTRETCIDIIENVMRSRMFNNSSVFCCFFVVVVFLFIKVLL